MVKQPNTNPNGNGPPLSLMHRCPAFGCDAAYAAKSSLSYHKSVNHPELVQSNGGARPGCGRERIRP